MMIRRVTMENFRYFSRKTIDFQNKPVILLSAANGVGKTTVADAIEWCLTGKIGRLKASYDTRSTNNTDRKNNAAGILKNRDVGKNDKVKVALTLIDGDQEIVLCREQDTDVLDPGKSIVTIDNDPEKAECFLRKHIGDDTQMESFYNFHFCDIQKSFNVQSTKRDKLKGLFEEFITNYDAHKQVAQNLDVFAEDVQRYIEDNKKKITPAEDIQKKEEELAKILARAKHTPYPAVLFYPEEKTDIAALSMAELTAQRHAIRNCGFLAAKQALDRLAKNEITKRQHSAIHKIAFSWETMGDSIQCAIAAGLHEDTNAIESREKKRNELKNLSITQSKILRIAPKLIALGNEHFTQADFDGYRQKIDTAEKQVKELSTEIEQLSGNNKMLTILSNLTGQKQVLTEYRDSAIREYGTVRCPVCGSDTFSELDADSILQEADLYIEQNNAAVNAKTEARTALQAQVDDLYQSLILRTKQTSAEAQQKLSDEIANLTALNTQVQPYFDAVRQLDGIRPEELSAERAKQLQSEARDSLLTEAQELEARIEYQQILTVLGYCFEAEPLQQTLAKVNGLITDPREITNFSYELLVAKINSLDGFLANQDFFAAIQTRNDRENMKIFFIDDLTACMDDVNMLAFLDILKYQMSSEQTSSKKTMDQLFFITCDERISDLLEYKLNGRGIGLCKLVEKDLTE